MSADCKDTIPAPLGTSPNVLRPPQFVARQQVPLYALALRVAARGCVEGARTLWLWRERARQRRHLSELNDRLLRDIGLTRDQVRAEYRKPFWQP